MLKLQRIDPYRWLLPRHGEMRTDGIVYADAGLLQGMDQGVLSQLGGVASLPGIVGSALAMPDAHQGYGFPIGGVAAFDPDEGVVSPGGVGYDINCGVRLLRSRLGANDLGPKLLAEVADALAVGVPAGVGSKGRIKLSDRDICRVLEQGAAWVVKKGWGEGSDLEFCEAGGCLPGADSEMVSQRALNRGRSQLGTLGAGNHFVELARVEKVFDQVAADAFGLEQGGLVVWVHSGSRGLGHQVCDDYLRELNKSSQAIHPKDRQLVAAPPGSKVGSRYVAAMAAAANFAFGNRQLLMHLVREVLGSVLGKGPAALGLGLVFDVAHNVAKLEQHKVQGKERSLWVHRKGATRALGPGHAELPARYRAVGQPVLVPGDMGRASYVLKGTHIAEAETFASSAHGAGRRMSRTQAKKQAKGRRVDMELLGQGVVVRAKSRATLNEEMPEAYKDASLVVGVMHGSGVATLVVKTKPLVVIKG